MSLLQGWRKVVQLYASAYWQHSAPLPPLLQCLRVLPLSVCMWLTAKSGPWRQLTWKNRLTLGFFSFYLTEFICLNVALKHLNQFSWLCSKSPHLVKAFHDLCCCWRDNLGKLCGEMPNEIRINNLLDQNNSFTGYQNFRGKPKLIEIKLSTNLKANY